MVHHIIEVQKQVEEQEEWRKGKEKKMEEEEESPTDQLVIYKQILEILKPGETVVKVGTVPSITAPNISGVCAVWRRL